MRKQKETIQPADVKVAQPGSVLITNARPLGSPKFGQNPGARTMYPDRDLDREGGREFIHPSHTDGRGRTLDE